jgi:hypothetical protein
LEAAFMGTKAAFSVAAPLAHLSATAELGLMEDTSSSHAALPRKENMGASGFFFGMLNPAQSKYSAFDQEVWVVLGSIRFFCYILKGLPFTVYTDHKPLASALKSTSEPWTARRQWDLSYIIEYTRDLSHNPGPSMW